jgi:predicted RNA-binding protein with PIN domain
MTSERQAETDVPYLIDGNNLLGSWGGVPPGDAGRLEVLRRVAAFCRQRRVRATIAFDGGPLRGDWPAQELGLVSVRVPAAGQDADAVIRQLIDGAARPREWIVVTSDRALYSYAKTRGAAVLRAHEWNAEARRPRADERREDDGEKPSRETDVDGWLERFERDRRDED